MSSHRDALPALTAALLEATLGTQRDAALLLGLFKRPEAARPLVLALGDRDLREAAMQALTMIGAPAAETLAACAPDLESELARRRLRALAAPRAGGVRSARAGAPGRGARRRGVGSGGGGGGGARRSRRPRGAGAASARRSAREEAVAHAAADALGRLGARHYDEVRVLVQSRGLGGADAPYLCRALGACGRADDAPFFKQALGADVAGGAPRRGRGAGAAAAVDATSTRR